MQFTYLGRGTRIAIVRQAEDTEWVTLNASFMEVSFNKVSGRLTYSILAGNVITGSDRQLYSSTTREIVFEVEIERISRTRAWKINPIPPLYWLRDYNRLIDEISLSDK